MSYCEKLPRKITEKRRCDALTDEGEPCKKWALAEVHYHGADTTEAEGRLCAGWVRVFMCREHIPAIDKRELKL